MKKKNKKLTVYSTNPNFEYDEENDENYPINPSDQLLEVWQANLNAVKVNEPSNYIELLYDVK